MSSPEKCFTTQCFQEFLFCKKIMKQFQTFTRLELKARREAKLWNSGIQIILATNLLKAVNFPPGNGTSERTKKRRSES